VELVNRKLTGNNLHFYVNPGRDSHEEALKVHGITTEFLQDKPPFAHIAGDLLAYLKDAEVIIHNAAFDVGFLDVELALAQHDALRTHVLGIVDTLVMAKAMFPGKRNSLDALCDRLGVDNSGRALHGALLDAELLADVYINLTRGQDALLMDVGDASNAALKRVKADLSKLELPVIMANDTELTAHDDVLRQIDKSSGGKTLWHKAA
jgi:DNA polymerase-3 subunit epsilon